MNFWSSLEQSSRTPLIAYISGPFPQDFQARKGSPTLFRTPSLKVREPQSSLSLVRSSDLFEVSARIVTSLSEKHVCNSYRHLFCTTISGMSQLETRRLYLICVPSEYLHRWLPDVPPMGLIGQRTTRKRVRREPPRTGGQSVKKESWQESKREPDFGAYKGSGFCFGPWTLQAAEKSEYGHFFSGWGGGRNSGMHQTLVDLYASGATQTGTKALVHHRSRSQIASDQRSQPITDTSIAGIPSERAVSWCPIAIRSRLQILGFLIGDRSPSIELNLHVPTDCMIRVFVLEITNVDRDGSFDCAIPCTKTKETGTKTAHLSIGLPLPMEKTSFPNLAIVVYPNNFETRLLTTFCGCWIWEGPNLFRNMGDDNKTPDNQARKTSQIRGECKSYSSNRALVKAIFEALKCH